jgi:aspartate/methionine/tyrosine aminotransferase
MAALINAGDEVLFESPAYEPLLALAHYLRADVKRFERRFEDGFRLSPGEIEKKISIARGLIVITNFHNPSGVLTDDDVLREVGRLPAA